MKQSFFILSLILFLLACENHPIPKPIGYFRIDLPSKNFKQIDSIPFPFRFNLPQYAVVNLEKTAENEKFLNVDFPQFNARLHMSYIRIDTNLPRLLEDSRALVYKHVEKAQDIGEQPIYNLKERKFGMLYGLDGNTASGSQFYITDSTQHFLRGALYFSAIPNYDSIAPVQEFIKEDLEEIIESLEWMY